jgi:hypothetical protein
LGEAAAGTLEYPELMREAHASPKLRGIGWDWWSGKAAGPQMKES